jgi:hypothetical protein
MVGSVAGRRSTAGGPIVGAPAGASTHPRAVEALIERRRRRRWTSTRIAAELHLAVSTVGAVPARLGRNRRSRRAPPEAPNREERRHPGELVHLDTKKRGRFERPGHRVTGPKRC